MGGPWCLPLRHGVDRAPGTDSVGGGDSVSPFPQPVLVEVHPVLVSGIWGWKQCQSAGSASLATDLQSTQAVKAA